MSKFGNVTLALALAGGMAVFATPSFAVEPDVDSPSGPELPMPRTDRPDFQKDDQAGAKLYPEEGTAVVPPDVAIVEPEDPAPDAVIVPE